MEITKNFKVRYLIDTLLGIWLLTWLWFLIFNWDIFVVKLNINLGIGVVKMFPFVVFMILGMLIMLAIRYILQYSRMLRRIEVKEKNTKIAMQEKDIEILKLKEMLYKEQTSELNKTAKDLTALNEKIDAIAQKFQKEKEEGNS
ncbi:MAG TPA: hypothetical protein DDX98_09680 [Bacteroidales bacterium]|jgi:type III secretory pathway component EscV|nr:hypothetical protein [Bacteroidales bacterium]